MRTLVAALGFLLVTSSAHAITIEQVTRGHELIEKISNEKKQLDQIQKDDCDTGKPWYAAVKYWVKGESVPAQSQSQLCCCIGCITYGYGYDPNLRDVNVSLDKPHIIAALKAQLDDDMKELNALGITP